MWLLRSQTRGARRSCSTRPSLEYWPPDTNNSEPSNQVTVTVPPSDDTTPPSPPEAVEVFVYETGVTTFTITEQSTDDTTPRSEIWYESLSYRYVDGQRDYYTIDANLPLEFDDASGHIAFPKWIRAVDQAGNRSEIVSPEFVLIDN